MNSSYCALQVSTDLSAFCTLCPPGSRCRRSPWRTTAEVIRKTHIFSTVSSSFLKGNPHNGRVTDSQYRTELQTLNPTHQSALILVDQFQKLSLRELERVIGVEHYPQLASALNELELRNFVLHFQGYWRLTIRGCGLAEFLLSQGADSAAGFSAEEAVLQAQQLIRRPGHRP
jgi:hypothetical protein